MFSQTLSLNNTRDIVANNTSLISGNDAINILDLFELSGGSSFYNKTYIDNLISNYLTQDQVITLLNDKWNVTDATDLYYSKLYVDSLILDYSTTTQTNTLLNTHQYLILN